MHVLPAQLQAEHKRGTSSFNHFNQSDYFWLGTGALSSALVCHLDKKKARGKIRLSLVTCGQILELFKCITPSVFTWLIINQSIESYTACSCAVIIIAATKPPLYQLMFFSKSSSGLNSQKNMLEFNDFFFFFSQHGIYASAVMRFGLVVTRCSLKPQISLLFHTDCLLCSGCSVIMSQAQTFLPFLSQYIPSSIHPNNWEINPVWNPFYVHQVVARRNLVISG